MYNIVIEDLDFSYKDKEILSNINLTINSGEFICILGPSGCGKSTLLKIIAGLENPTNGSIKINNKEIKSPGLDRGVVFQDYSLFSWMTTGENIELAIKQAFKDLPSNEVKEISKNYLSKVGLENEYNKLPGSLSGGMRQRAAIARAFSIDPPVLLMDEPFGALDVVTRNKLQDLTLSLWSANKNKKTIIFVTHDVDEALLLSEKMIIMSANNKGIERIVEIDKTEKRDRKNLYLNDYYLNLKNELIKLLNL